MTTTKTLIRQVLRTDGSSQELPAGKSMEELAALIGAEVLDVVQLRSLGEPLHVMLLDDLGYSKHLPVNVEATKLYLAQCIPGTTHKIRGDVVIVPDDDCVEEEAPA